MFNWKFLKKVKIKGVSMVEYAVLLAFVAVVAGVFIDDGGLKGGIQGSVDKVLVRLGVLEDKDDNIAKWSENDYKGILEGIYGLHGTDKENEINKFLLTCSGYQVNSDNVEAVAKLKELGINLPDGKGNWVMQGNDNGKFYFAYTLDEYNTDTANAKTILYQSGTAPVVFYGYTSTNSTGQLKYDNSTKLKGYYTIENGYYVGGLERNFENQYNNVIKSYNDL